MGRPAATSTSARSSPGKHRGDDPRPASDAARSRFSPPGETPDRTTPRPACSLPPPARAARRLDGDGRRTSFRSSRVLHEDHAGVHPGRQTPLSGSSIGLFRDRWWRRPSPPADAASRSFWASGTVYCCFSSKHLPSSPSRGAWRECGSRDRATAVSVFVCCVGCTLRARAKNYRLDPIQRFFFSRTASSKRGRSPASTRSQAFLYSAPIGSRGSASPKKVRS